MSADPMGFCDYIEKTPLRVQFNREGGGLQLCVDRGIPCEGHTQVFSAHCTNTPDAEDIAAELKEFGEHYQKQWAAFAELMHSMNSPSVLKRDTDWATKEAIASIFCCWLIKQIAQGAEKRQEQRWEKEYRNG